MKRIFTLLVCILIGAIIGWYFGYSRPVVRNQRELLKQGEYFRNHTQEFDAAAAVFYKMRKEESEVAKPWEASTASIALVALNDVDTNNLEDAKFRLATLIATYYRAHTHDGNTNLLNHIASYAATNSALSNVIYGSWP